MIGLRVLVLGASGFIGRHIAERLAMRGASVIAASLRAVPFASPGIRAVHGPLDTTGAFAALLQHVDVVVHAASSTTPGSSGHAPLLELDANLRSTLALLTALQDAPGRRLVYLSSGGTLYGDAEHATEDSPLRPRSYHGAGKASAELFIGAWVEQFDGAAVVLRPSNVYGEGQPAKAGFGVIPASFQCLAAGRPLVIWGDGTAVRDYLYVDDLVRLVERVLEPPSWTGFEVYNAARGQGTSLNALMSCIERVAGRPVLREYRPARTTDVGVVVPDPARALAAFGWEPCCGLEQGLTRTWNWFASSA